MPVLLRPASLASLLFSGAIFGFFYAWVCSTMWGLDAADPRIAIAAMNAMNDTVQNPVFGASFFGTPVVLAATAVIAWRAGVRRAAIAFAAAALLYTLGAFAVTVSINVPMNRALLGTEIPDNIDAARAIWEAYSPRWQAFNTLRTVVSGFVLLVAGWGLMDVGRAT